MKHNEIEAKLKNAVSNAAPDVLENILRACDQKKGTVIEMEQKANTNKGKNKALRVCAAIAAAAAMLVMGVLIGRGSGHTPLYASDVAAIISLDVNPSVELRVDATEKVLAAEARNADGEAVLAGMELAGTELNVAVNAIVGSMLKLGYIDELANSILISVECMDGTDAKALESKLVAEVEAVFAQNPVGSGAILSQNVSDADYALSAKAGEYGITVGKAALIEEILQGNARYTFEELAGLSINELNLLAKMSASRISTPSARRAIKHISARMRRLKRRSSMRALRGRMQPGLRWSWTAKTGAWYTRWSSTQRMRNTSTM